MTSIGHNAFYNCTSLTSIDLSMCTSIRNSTFGNCINLNNVTLRASTVCTLMDANAFYSTPMSLSTLTGKYGSIYVPASLVAAYQSASNWSVYASRITALN